MARYKRIMIKRRERSAREKKLIASGKLTERQKQVMQQLLKERYPIWLIHYSPETKRVLVRKKLIELVKKKGYRLSVAGREYMYLTRPWLF